MSHLPGTDRQEQPHRSAEGVPQIVETSAPRAAPLPVSVPAEPLSYQPQFAPTLQDEMGVLMARFMGYYALGTGIALVVLPVLILAAGGQTASVVATIGLSVTSTLGGLLVATVSATASRLCRENRIIPICFGVMGTVALPLLLAFA